VKSPVMSDDRSPDDGATNRRQRQGGWEAAKRSKR
jgi:hypothetical protein